MRLALAVAGLAAAAAGPAQADPTFDVFHELCVKTRAEAPAALAAADAQGWTDMPAMFLDEIAKQGFSGGEGRARNRNRTLMLMYAGKGVPVIDGQPLPVRACAVAARPANAKALKKAAAAWAGVPAHPKLPAEEGEAYAFTDEGGVHRPIAAAHLGTPRGKDLIRQGRVALLLVAGRPAAPLLVYAIPTL